MKDLMIDLETLGTHDKAPIISIGAVWFDIESKKMGNTFYATLDVADQMDTKVRFADASTIKWWMTQKDAAKNVFKEGAQPTKEVLDIFSEWVLKTAGATKGAKATKKCNPWGNGSSFDLTLMTSIFRDYKVPCPWLFYNEMDLRTYRRFIGKGQKVEKLGTDHNALDDAISQVKYIFDVTP